MRFPLILTFLIIFCFASSCDKPRSEIKVYSSNTLKGLSFHLHQSNFKFIYVHDEATESTTGSVEEVNDTLFLKYNKANNLRADTIRKIGGFVPIAELFSPKRFMMRPPKLLIQGDKLLYLDPRTNQPVNVNNQQLFLERTR